MHLLSKNCLVTWCNRLGCAISVSGTWSEYSVVRCMYVCHHALDIYLLDIWGLCPTYGSPPTWWVSPMRCMSLYCLWASMSSQSVEFGGIDLDLIKNIKQRKTYGYNIILRCDNVWELLLWHTAEVSWTLQMLYRDVHRLAACSILTNSIKGIIEMQFKARKVGKIITSEERAFSCNIAVGHHNFLPCMALCWSMETINNHWEQTLEWMKLLLGSQHTLNSCKVPILTKDPTGQMNSMQDLWLKTNINNKDCPSLQARTTAGNLVRNGGQRLYSKEKHLFYGSSKMPLLIIIHLYERSVTSYDNLGISPLGHRLEKQHVSSYKVC